MATLRYDGQNHTLEIFGHDGKSKGHWPASNDIDSAYAREHYGGHTHLRNGVYAIQDKLVPHWHTADPDGEYGMHGTIRLAYDTINHPGVAIHAGRAFHKHKPGAQHPTHGCIRTTDAAMLAIRDIMAKDHLQTVTIVHNSAASSVLGHGKHSHTKHPHA